MQVAFNSDKSCITAMVSMDSETVELGGRLQVQVTESIEAWLAELAK